MEQKLEPRKEGSGFGRGLEMILVFAGAFLNMIVVVLFAVQQTGMSGGDILHTLFPLLYFIEILGLSFLAILPLIDVEQGNDRSTWLPVLPWIAAGGLLAFVILGGFSIGFYLAPGTVAFVAAGILADRRQNLPIAGHVAILFLATAVQAGIMLLVVAL
jgi:hypothetical protein